MVKSAALITLVVLMFFGNSAALASNVLVEAAKEAGQRGCPLMVSFISLSDKECVRMKFLVLMHVETYELLNNFAVVMVEVDPASYPRMTEQLNVRLFPTVLFLTPALKEIDRISGFIPREQFYAQFKRITSGKMTFMSIRNSVESGSADPREHFQLALWLLERGLFREAEERFGQARLYGSQEDEVYFGLGLAAREQGQHEKAARLMEQALAIGGEDHRKLYQLCLTQYYGGMYLECVLSCRRLFASQMADTGEFRPFSLYLKGLCFSKLGLDQDRERAWRFLRQTFPNSRHAVRTTKVNDQENPSVEMF
ncbi:MAG: hypothetical protein PHQ23_11715 [Candidatus Wallbacteria bacterium]|nr:hypothetical protein [Candidatus Wallbacteria bacterium]